MSHTIHGIWEEKYSAGHAERYPWDSVVSFVFRYAPRNQPRSEVSILEIGCGTGGNLWFAAREGFVVAGIDNSRSAIRVAQARFAEEGLSGIFVLGDFTEPLPFADETFDLAVDRGAIVCAGFSLARRTVKELHRVVKPGGRFLFNPYSKMHTSFVHATPIGDGLVDFVKAGTLTGVGSLCFYDEDMVREVLACGWVIESLVHMESRDIAKAHSPVHAEWSAVASKLARSAVDWQIGGTNRG